MSEGHSAESGAGYSYLEYGVLVDRTSVGLGVYLAKTFRFYDDAQAYADAGETYPSEVQQRVVSMTDWQPMTRLLPPGSTEATS